jgi:hypothetical protein
MHSTFCWYVQLPLKSGEVPLEAMIVSAVFATHALTWGSVKSVVTAFQQSPPSTQPVIPSVTPNASAFCVFPPSAAATSLANTHGPPLSPGKMNEGPNACNDI